VEGLMRRAKHVALVLVFLVLVMMVMSLYNISLNGRYQGIAFLGSRLFVILDTRTGTWVTANADRSERRSFSEEDWQELLRKSREK
jgi:hypothetical protein